MEKAWIYETDDEDWIHILTDTHIKKLIRE